MENNKTAQQEESSQNCLVVANEILASGHFQECSVEEALQQHAKPRAPPSTNNADPSLKETKGEKNKKCEPLRSFWIDADNLNTPDLSCLPDDVLAVLPPFVKRHLMQASQLTTPQTLVLPESVLVVLPIIPSGGTLSSIQNCAVICLQNLLLTIVAPISSSTDDCSNSSNSNTSQPPQPPSSLHQRLGMTRKLFYEYQLSQGNTTSALCALFQVQSSRVSRVLEQLQNATATQYKQMQQDADSVSKSEILNLVDELMQLESVTDEQYQVFTILSKDQSIAAGTLDSKTLHEYLKALLATSSATKRSAARLEKRQMHVYKMYESRQQEHVKHRLNLLTIFSTVFLPITFLAGIWGMNFINMPELETQNGYYFALGTMAAIAVGMTLIFWQRGWFNMS